MIMDLYDWKPNKFEKLRIKSQLKHQKMLEEFM